MRSLVGFVVALTLASVSCSSSNNGLTVSAAASLITVLGTNGAGPLASGQQTTVNYGGSAILAEQLLDGFAADVFLAADDRTMQRVVDAGLVVGSPTVFATNHLVVAVPAGNPAGVARFKDLATQTLLVGTCAPVVPCGRLAVAEAHAAGIVLDVDTEEPDVRTLLAKLRSGELDVALIYATDAASADGAVEVIETLETTTIYEAAVIVGGDERAAASFVAGLLSDASKQVLLDAGFGRP